MSDAAFHTSPIDDRARDGSFRIVLAEGHFNLVRWCAEAQAFVFGAGVPLQGAPDGYVTQIGSGE
jgi:hypothetical protein